jgi:hypothetical protein
MAIPKVFGYGRTGKFVLSVQRQNLISRLSPEPMLVDIDITKPDTNCLVDAYKSFQRKLKSDTSKVIIA